MLHFIRFLRHSTVFLFICLPLMLLGIPLVAIALLVISKDCYKLPRLFRWWDCADMYVGRDFTAYLQVCKQGKMARYKWLVFRNPINYFDYMYLGLVWEGSEVYTHYNPKNDDVGDDTRSGFRYIEVTRNSDTRFYEYYWIYRYPFKKDVCFRYRCGWKIANNQNKIGSYTQWCLVISPWHSFTGK